MKWVFVDKDRLIEKYKTKGARLLDNGQYLVRVNKSNELFFKDHIKYSKKQLLNLDLNNSYFKFDEKIEDFKLPSPFANKKYKNKNLFRRKHGFFSDEIAPQTSGVVSLVVPYDLCKINTLEIVNCSKDINLDFKVYDTPIGSISGVENYMLNQFGYNVEMPESGMYRDVSEYDADLIKSMKIEITINNESNETYKCRGNIVYHEVKL